MPRTGVVGSSTREWDQRSNLLTQGADFLVFLYTPQNQKRQLTKSTKPHLYIPPKKAPHPPKKTKRTMSGGHPSPAVHPILLLRPQISGMISLPRPHGWVLGLRDLHVPVLFLPLPLSLPFSTITAAALALAPAAIIVVVVVGAVTLAGRLPEGALLVEDAAACVCERERGDWVVVGVEMGEQEWMALIRSSSSSKPPRRKQTTNHSRIDSSKHNRGTHAWTTSCSCARCPPPFRPTGCAAAAPASAGARAPPAAPFQPPSSSSPTPLPPRAWPPAAMVLLRRRLQRLHRPRRCHVGGMWAAAAGPPSVPFFEID